MESNRSRMMASIRAKDTRPEMMVRRFLHACGYRFRLHDRRLPGSPDIVLPRWRTVVEVRGCFWHAHEGCDRFRIPKTRTEWWRDKLMRNRERDGDNLAGLIDLGWNVVVVWECALCDRPDEALQELTDILAGIADDDRLVVRIIDCSIHRCR